MTGKVWLSVCYTGDFILSDGVLSWVFEGGIERGKVIPFLIPSKITYLELYEKLIEKLKIDSSVYEMVLRCVHPMENKDPLYSLPYSIFDDDSVDWLVSYGDKTRLCVTLKLKKNTASVVGRDEVNEMNHELGVMSEVMATDNTCLIIEDGVDRSLETDNLMQSDGSVKAGGLGLDDVHGLGGKIDDIEPTEALHGSVGNVSKLPAVKIEEMHNEVAREVGMCGDDPLLESLGEDAWLANETSQDQILMTHGSQSLPWYVPEEEDVNVNDIFNTKNQLKEKLQLLGLKHHFEFKTKRSDNTRYLVTCKTEKCMWRLQATNLGASKVFEVRKYERCHSCPRSLSNKYHRHASSTLIGKIFAPNFQDSNHVSKPKDVMRDFSRQYGYELKYATVYNAKKHWKKLIRGNSTDSQRIQVARGEEEKAPGAGYSGGSFGGGEKGDSGNGGGEVEGDGYSVCCKKGKEEMEDRYSAALGIHGDSKQAFVGILDGHGGAKAAEFAAENLHKVVSELKLPDASFLLNSPSVLSNPHDVLDHSSRAASAMAESVARKRELNGLTAIYPHSKFPKGSMPHSNGIPNTIGNHLLPPQLVGRSNVVTEDISKLFGRKQTNPST